MRLSYLHSLLLENLGDTVTDKSVIGRWLEQTAIEIDRCPHVADNKSLADILVVTRDGRAITAITAKCNACSTPEQRREITARIRRDLVRANARGIAADQRARD